jgi:hypothetical protein
MIAWETVRSEFAWEGSWRDICIPGVDIKEWQAVMNALRAGGLSGELTVNGATSAMPDDISTLFRLADGVTALWSSSLAGVVLFCHFFDRSEIEFDLDPREVKGQAEIDGLLGFMRTLAKATGKVVLMTPENMHDVPFVRVTPSGAAEYISSGGFFEKLARGRS